MKKINSNTAVALLLILTVTITSHAVPNQPEAWEKCAGISKAGKNKCGATDGSHKCGGLAKHDNSDVDWIYVAKGTCETITGGRVIKVMPAKPTK